MNRKGIVTYADNTKNTAKVQFMEIDASISPELPVAAHVGNLTVNNKVMIAYASSSEQDGIIIAKWGDG